ncbi:MAG: amidohydrolase family protein [Thaumarchaeota archaeon]|nr:amidohydrolase family protein [Nitrososphaerota archaeon]MCL5069150.1 amidohydrolase family protein [Nitrososphaerota archaeon]
MSSKLTLENCNVVDVAASKIEDNVNMLIEGGRITKVAKNVSPEGERIDLGGRFVLPGLFNMHNNLSLVFPFKDTDLDEPPAITVLRCYRRAHDALVAGVTTLRTVGEQNRVDIYLRKMIESGWVPGPRLFVAGKALSTVGGHGSDFGQNELSGPEEFRRAARYELSLGANHLKVFITGGIAKKEEAFEESQMTKEEIEAVTSVARSKGTYVCAHAGGSRPIMTAVEAGVKCFEHGYVLSREAARAIKESEGYLDPTLSVTRSPEWMREHNFEEWTIEKAVSAGETHLHSIKNAVAEGVKILNGTDMPAGDLSNGVNATIREIEYLTDAGLSPVEALRAATTNSAELCGVSDQLGQVKEGYLADLIAVPSNPISDIRALEKIQLVMKGGEVIRNDIE